MAAPRQTLLDAVLAREIVQAGVAPAATAGVAVRHENLWVGAYGAAGKVGGHPTEIETPFDLASVTKPLFAVTCARLVARGRLSWETPLAALLPGIAGTPAGGKTIEEHLSHRAGLQAHVDLFAPLQAGRPIQVAAALRHAAQSARPNEPRDALYSDLGFLLVGRAVVEGEREPLDALLRRELGAVIGTEIGSSRQWRAQDRAFTEHVAPTEHVPWRGGTLRGVVHDDNAWALAGYGSCGHAGLFGTAPAVLRFGIALLDSLAGRSAPTPGAHGLLAAERMAHLLRRRPGGTLRLGFDVKSGDSSMAGKVAGPNTFGHLGYTGTSLWCDPDAQVVTVLLTNRVHPTSTNRRIREARPRVQDELFQLAWNCRAPSRMASVMLPLSDPAGLGDPQD